MPRASRAVASEAATCPSSTADATPKTGEGADAATPSSVTPAVATAPPRRRGEGRPEQAERWRRRRTPAPAAPPTPRQKRGRERTLEHRARSRRRRRRRRRDGDGAAAAARGGTPRASRAVASGGRRLPQQHRRRYAKKKGGSGRGNAARGAAGDGDGAAVAARGMGESRAHDRGRVEHGGSATRWWRVGSGHPPQQWRNARLTGAREERPRAARSRCNVLNRWQAREHSIYSIRQGLR